MRYYCAIAHLRGNTGLLTVILFLVSVSTKRLKFSQRLQKLAMLTNLHQRVRQFEAFIFQRTVSSRVHNHIKVCVVHFCSIKSCFIQNAMFIVFSCVYLQRNIEQGSGMF